MSRNGTCLVIAVLSITVVAPALAQGLRRDVARAPSWFLVHLGGGRVWNFTHYLDTRSFKSGAVNVKVGTGRPGTAGVFKRLRFGLEIFDVSRTFVEESDTTRAERFSAHLFTEISLIPSDKRLTLYPRIGFGYGNAKQFIDHRDMADEKLMDDDGMSIGLGVGIDVRLVEHLHIALSTDLVEQGLKQGHNGFVLFAGGVRWRANVP